MAGFLDEIFSSTEFQLLLWLHYLDILCLCTDQLKDFFYFLNTFLASIKFIMEHSQH